MRCCTHALVPAIAGKVDNDGRLVFAELAGRVGWLKPNGEHTGNTKLQRPSVLLVLAATAFVCNILLASRLTAMFTCRGTGYST